MSHLCKQCSKPIQHASGDSKSRRDGRVYCSQACNIAAMKKPAPPRDCPACLKPMVKRDGESHSDFMRRTACSRVCGNTLQWARRHNRLAAARAELQSKPCLHCNKMMAQRKDGGQQEFLKRKYCSHKCACAHRSRESRQRWNSRFDGTTAVKLRETVPAATEAEWLRLNGGPTKCPTMYVSAVEHRLHVPAIGRSGRV